MDQIRDSKFEPSWWWVVFVPKPFEHWFDIFSPRWCRHVFVFGYTMESHSWVVIDPAQEKTHLLIYRDEDFTGILANYCDADCVIVQIKAQKTHVLRHRLFQTCSTVVARVIGISGNSLTPHELAKTLRRYNTIVKRDPNNVYQNKNSRRRPRNKSPS